MNYKSDDGHSPVHNDWKDAPASLEFGNDQPELASDAFTPLGHGRDAGHAASDSAALGGDMEGDPSAVVPGFADGVEADEEVALVSALLDIEDALPETDIGGARGASAPEGDCQPDCPGDDDPSVGTWIPISEILSREVSQFEFVTDTQPDATLTIAEIVDAVRNHAELNAELRTKVEEIRLAIEAGATEAEVKALKRRLPAFTTSAVMTGRLVETLQEHSGLLQVDLDHLPPGEVDPLFERLRLDPHVAVVFRSPSGNLKAIVAIPRDAALHGRSFEMVRRYFLETYGVALDPSTKDIGRLCYFSSDPDIHVATGSVLQFEPDEEPPRGATNERPAPPDRGENPLPSARANDGRAEEPANPERFPVLKVRSLLAAISRGGRPDYNEWLMIIAATRAAIGVDEVALDLLREFFPEETPGEYERKFREGLGHIPAKHLVREARRQGWHSIDASVVDLLGALSKGPEARAIERPPVIIDGLLRCGEMLLLAGKTKARKSFMALQMALAVARGRNLFGRCGFEEFSVTRGNVLLFDLENPRDEATERCCAALEAIEDREERLCAVRRIKLHALRGMELDDLTEEIIATIRREAGPGDLVIVDCLYHLIDGDISDMASVAKLLRRFSSVAAEIGCGVVIIDHFRKGGFGSAGDQILGSVAKSMTPDAVVTMQRRGREEVYTICADVRSFPSFENFMLEYDDATKQFRRIHGDVARDPNSAQRRRDLAKMRMAWSERPEARLSRAACERVWNCSPSGAGNVLVRLRKRGWVESCGGGRGVTYRVLPLGEPWLSEGTEVFEVLL